MIGLQEMLREIIGTPPVGSENVEYFLMCVIAILLVMGLMQVFKLFFKI